MLLRPLLTALVLVFLASTSLSAHEFWVEPTEYQVESGALLEADFLNGQKFKGGALAYFSKRSARLDIIAGGKTVPYTGRMGDVPAIHTTAPEEGLLVIVHQTAPSTLKYTSWEKFQAFADHKAFPDMRARHDARGLPESGFTELYTRYVKALVAVGDGKGSDARTGMETEFVALSNPYTINPETGLDVQLLYQNEPRADAQVEIFDRSPDGAVTIRLLQTDPSGRARIAVESGHTYLLDAVVLRPAPDDSVAVWESLWAAMTFAVP